MVLSSLARGGMARTITQEAVYRGGMRWALVIAWTACSSQGKDGPPPIQAKPAVPRPTAPAAVVADAGPPLPEHQTLASVGEAIVKIVPADTRVIGFGELHARVDRAAVKSALASFTDALPTFATQISDLIVETW